MIPRPVLDPINAVAAEAPPVVTAKPAAAALQLGGDEIIQLSIRPSPWCIALYSIKLVLACVLLAAALTVAVQGQPARPAALALIALVLLALCGILVATLQWASQLYVLTNRRVLRFYGIFSVEVAQCALTQIHAVVRHSTWYHPLLRLGSLHFVTGAQHGGHGASISGRLRVLRMLSGEPAGGAGLDWEHVARPGEVHEILARAIQRAQTGQ
jgi:hypothetical protein